MSKTHCASCGFAKHNHCSLEYRVTFENFLMLQRTLSGNTGTKERSHILTSAKGKRQHYAVHVIRGCQIMK